MSKQDLNDKAVEELYLHVFISIMVLIKDFYGAFGAVYDEPYQEELAASIELIWGLEHIVYIRTKREYGQEVADELAGRLQEELVTKISNELFPAQDDSLRANLLDAKKLLRENMPKDADATEDEIIDMLASRIAHVVRSADYKTYAKERITKMFNESVDFNELIKNICK
jgi:hypothetical protein